MRIGDVMDDLGRALEETGLRVHPYSVKMVYPPAAIVGWPNPINYDSTMRRGGDRFDIPIQVLVGNVDSRSSRDALSAYLDGSGPQSIKFAVESHLPFAYDSARVKNADVAILVIGAVDYLAATFTVDIIGKGA